MPDLTSPEYDVIVVGAGIGGLYGVKRFRDQGLSVLGLEAAPEVGGVWYHNSYPGARVDTQSIYYSYYFDPELYREWNWTERYAVQAELLAYLQHVADRYDLRRLFRFNTRMTSGTWDPRNDRYTVTTDTGETFTGRYLVMATGQLSKGKPPAFPGLDEFEGEWSLTSDWRPVTVDDVRVAVVGTGSSGVQATTAISKRASHLYVLQRTPGWIVPVVNGPFDASARDAIAESLEESWTEILESAGGYPTPPPAGKASDFTPEERRAILEKQWAEQPVFVFSVFSDIGTDAEANEVISEFVREKTRARIDDPAVADKLINRIYPIGSRRVVFDTGYYESFNRPNVTLVDVGEDPIERITRTGIRLASGREIEVDTIAFALGFEAFTGAINAANIRNEHGAGPFDHWQRGPQTYLGLMTEGFPNLFMVTGPGSPSTLSGNLNMSTVQHLDFIGELIAATEKRGAHRIEPSHEAVEAWTAHAAEVAEPLLRRQDDYYFVHVNDDGSRIMIPYTGGVGDYVKRCNEIIARDFEGFVLT